MALLNGVKLIVKRLSNVHRPGDRPDIFIFSLPRSGTTLLMELVHTQKAIKFCPEPLNVRNPEVRKHLGVENWDDLLPNPRRLEMLADYFGRIRANKVPFLNPNPLRANHHFRTDRIIFKVIHGGEDIIDWFAETFAARILFLIRHPIAVTLSRQVYPRLPSLLRNEEYRSQFSPAQTALAESIIARGDDFEQGILSWCLRNFPPLKLSERKGWVFVCYEDLVMNPETVIPRLAERLDLPDPEAMIRRADRPSSTVYKSDRETQAAFRNSPVRDNRSFFVSKWQRRIDKEQEKAAFAIVDRFEIDVYRFGEVMPARQYLLSAE